jgi:hypothetical protein
MYSSGLCLADVLGSMGSPTVWFDGLFLDHLCIISSPRLTSQLILFFILSFYLTQTFQNTTDIYV